MIQVARLIRLISKFLTDQSHTTYAISNCVHIHSLDEFSVIISIESKTNEDEKFCQTSPNLRSWNTLTGKYSIVLIHGVHYFLCFFDM